MTTSLRDGNIEIGEGEGQLTVPDGNDNATVTIGYIQNLTESNKPTFVGYTIWNTNSTGVLAPFDNLFGVLKGNKDLSGNNYTYKVWEVR